MTRRLVAAASDPARRRARPRHRAARRGLARHAAAVDVRRARRCSRRAPRNGVAVEINSRPERQDPPDELHRARARARMPLLDRLRRARAGPALADRPRRAARRAGGGAAGADRHDLAARPAARVDGPRPLTAARHPAIRWHRDVTRMPACSSATTPSSPRCSTLIDWHARTSASTRSSPGRRATAMCGMSSPTCTPGTSCSSGGTPTG